MPPTPSTVPPPSPKPLRAADLSAAAILAVLNKRPGELHTHWDIEGTPRVLDPGHPDAPEKVLRAKLRGMLRRGLIRGCGCGCRGDWRTIVRVAPPEPAPSTPEPAPDAPELERVTEDGYFVVARTFGELEAARDASIAALAALGIAAPIFTCVDCRRAYRCRWAFDAYNTDGDCLDLK